LLSDTNRWNRMTGVAATEYTFELLRPDDPTSRTRIGHASYLGIPLHFAEEGWYWSGAWLHGERRFTGFVGALFARGILDVAAEGEGGQTRARLRCALSIVGVAGYLLAPILLLSAWLKMRRYLRQLRRTVERMPAGALGDPSEPPAATARRALFAAGAGERLVTGAAAKPAREAVRARAAKFASAPVAPDVQRRLVEFLTRQPDEALFQVRPFELARAWGLDRKQVLRGFLHATRAGLFDLDWQVNCPTCRVGTEAVSSLAELGRRVHCSECDISFDADFADNVEATFTANAAIRSVPRLVFCASSPFFRPHVHGYVLVPPRATERFSPLPRGDLLLRARGTPRQIRVDGGDRGRPVAIRVTDAAIERMDTHGAPDGDADALVVDNATDRPVRLLVERGGWSADMARGSVLLTLPDYHALFGAEAPATGQRLSIGTFAVLFTDVVGSTELYEQLGDAKAFALIQEHWRLAGKTVADRDGAVVKTMGDGLMCCFRTIGDALAASLDIIDQTEELSEREGVAFAVRVGANEGPCYAVRTHDRLDLFGSTVNMAARLMGAAPGRQIALLSGAVAHPALLARLAEERVVLRKQTTEMRGITGTHELVFAWRTGVEVFSTGEHPSARLA
jgi:class 3 adenylate cyclase